jgi:hypothetical protein
MTRKSLHWRLTLASAALLGLFLMLAPGSAAAYSMSGMGGRLGYTSPEDLDGTASVSVHAELERSGTRLHLMPNVAYWNVDRVRDLNPNFDVYYHFGPEGRVNPYLGGGLGLNFVQDRRFDRGDTNLGMNMVGGLAFPGSSSSTRHYFLEGRVTASDVNQVSVLTGVTFKAP